MAEVVPNLDRRIAGLTGVQAAVKAVTEQVASVARADLEQHRQSGEHQIVVERPNHLDYDIVLTGPAAVTVEYGRDGYTRPDGTNVGPMDGLGIMRHAAESAHL